MTFFGKYEKKITLSCFRRRSRAGKMKKNEKLLAERALHIPQGPFKVHPIFVEKAKGAMITDVDGKGYIDPFGGAKPRL